MATTLKLSFRTAVREYAEAKDRSLDSLNDFQRSRMMTTFYVKEVVRKLYPGIVPDDDEDYQECFVDGSCDCGLDFIYRSDEGHVLLVQAKYHGSGKAEKEETVNHFADVFKRIHPAYRSKHKISQRVREAVEDIDWSNDTFDLHFITLGTVNQNMRAREEQGVSVIPEEPEINSRVDFVVLDESGLNDKIREAASAGERIAIPVTVRFSTMDGQTPWIWYRSPSGRTSYLGLVSASQLRNMYKQHRYRLFALNIRYYVGDTSTNKGIISTAIDEPENFYFFNNGIAAVATKIEANEKTGELVCEQLSIINGAQTVRSLAKAHTKDPLRAGDANVLIRVSEVSLKQSEGEQYFLDNVTKFNNTQNAVKIADFRSNDGVQRALANRFAKVHRGNKEYWYKNKRVGERQQNKIPIGMEEFAKTLFAFLFGPVDAFGGTQHLFDTGPAGGYVKIFGDGHDVWDSITEEDFKYYAGIWLVSDRIRELSKVEKERLEKKELSRIEEDQKSRPNDKPVEPIVRRALERRWMIIYAVAELLKEKYAGGDLSADLRALSKPKWLDEDGGAAEALARYNKAACEVLTKVYRVANSRAGFAHRNWFRSSDTLQAIRQEVRDSTSILEGLPYLR